MPSTLGRNMTLPELGDGENDSTGFSRLYTMIRLPNATPHDIDQYALRIPYPSSV